MPTPDDHDDAVFERFSRRLRGDVLRYLPSVAVPSLTSLAFITIFTRVFDPASFGRYSVVFVTCTILSQMFSGWMSQAVIRYLPRYRANNDTVLFKSMLSALLLAVLVALAGALALVYPFVRDSLGGYRAYYLPGAVMVVSTVAYQVLRSLFQANLQSQAYARAEVLSSLARLAFALAFVYLVSRDAVGLIVGAALSSSLLAAVMIPWHRLPAAVRSHPRGFRLTLAPSFLRYGLPMIGWMIGVKVLELSDRYIIEYLRGSAEVGVYSANYGIASMGIWIVATPVLLAAHPLIFNAWESGGRPRIQELVSLFSRYYLLAAIPLAAYVVVFARDIAALLLGESFRGGYAVVPVVFVGLLLWNFGFYGHKTIKLLEKTGLMFAMVCVCAVVNIAMNFVLIPAHGYMGAAVATLIAAALYPAMVFVVTRRYLAWVIPWWSLGRIALAAGIAGGAAALVVSFLSTGMTVVRLATGAVVGAVVYAAMITVLCELRAEDRDTLRAIFRGKQT